VWNKCAQFEAKNQVNIYWIIWSDSCNADAVRGLFYLHHTYLQPASEDTAGFNLAVLKQSDWLNGLHLTIQLDSESSRQGITTEIDLVQ